MRTISKVIFSISLIIIFVWLKRLGQNAREIKQLRLEIKQLRLEHAQEIKQLRLEHAQEVREIKRQALRTEKELDRSELKVEQLRLELSRQGERARKTSKEFEQMKQDLRETKKLLEELTSLHIKQMGPIFASLLIKGTCSMLKWHGKGLYSREIKPSVGQLNVLNDKLDLVPREQEVQRMQALVKEHPDGPPVSLPASYHVTIPPFLSSNILQGQSLVGNGEETDVIDSKFQKQLRKLETGFGSRAPSQVYVVPVASVDNYWNSVDSGRHRRKW